MCKHNVFYVLTFRNLYSTITITLFLVIDITLKRSQANIKTPIDLLELRKNGGDHDTFQTRIIQLKTNS